MPFVRVEIRPTWLTVYARPNEIGAQRSNGCVALATCVSWLLLSAVADFL